MALNEIEARYNKPANYGDAIQLTPTPTDFKGPTIFICYRQIFFLLLPMKRLKKYFSEDLSIASVVGGFPLLAGPIERDSTVYNRSYS